MCPGQDRSKITKGICSAAEINQLCVTLNAEARLLCRGTCLDSIVSLHFVLFAMLGIDSINHIQSAVQTKEQFQLGVI